jgi:hypothetical protein
MATANQASQGVKQLKEPTALSFQYHLRDIRGCGHFRAFKPMLALNNLDHPLLQTSAFASDRVILADGSYSNINLVVFQSVAGQEYTKVIRNMRRMLDLNQFLIYDTDDNLFDIPSWNFAAEHYKPEVLDDISQMMTLADLVSVSTEYLKGEYSQFNKNIVVQPNRLIKAIWGEPTWINHNNKKPRIMYAGSDNHFSVSESSDVGDFSMELIEFIKETVDKYEWVLIGGCPASLRGLRGKGIEYYTWHSLLHFYPLMQRLKIDINLAPLQHNDFNKSKSNLKALESTALGVPLVCTDIEPYKGLPGAHYETSDMIEAIKGLAENPERREKEWQAMHDMLRQELVWEENDNTVKYVNNFTRAVYGWEVPLGMGNKLNGAL